MIDRSDNLRSMEEIFQPDPRSGVNAPMPKRTLETHRNEIAGLVLHDGVPKDVQVQFLTACNLLLYAWFVFRFFHVAEMHALATLELALKHRLNQAAPGAKLPHGLHQMLHAAVGQGLLRDDGLRDQQRRMTAQARGNEELRRAQEMIDRASAAAPGSSPRVSELEPSVEPMNNREIVQILANRIPKWRNVLAHGSTVLYADGVRRVEVCADLINQLFERPSTPIDDGPTAE